MVAARTELPADVSWDQAPQIAEMGPDRLLMYCTSDHKHIAHYAQCVVAKILASIPERDDHWIQFAAGAFGLSDRDLRDHIAHRDDSVVLIISMHLVRQSILFHFYDWDALMAFSKINILKTLPGLRHDFCVLWNEVVQEARRQGPGSPPVKILRYARHQYIGLHQDTDAAPTDFSPYPSSYPLCDITHHRSFSTVPAPDPLTIPFPPQPSGLSDGILHQPTPGGSTAPQQLEGVKITTEPPSRFDQTTVKEIRDTAEALTTVPLTFPIDSGPRRVTFAPPPAAGENDDGHDRNQAIPIEGFRHQTQSLRRVPSPTDASTSSLKREGHQHGLN